MTLGSFLRDALLAEAGLAAIMAIAWAIQRRTGNSGWIDASWTFGVGVVGAALALAPDAQGAAPVWRRATVAIFALVWSLRLCLHIVGRTLKMGDDPRYRKLITEWGADAPRRLLAFAQAQAVVGAALALALALAAATPGANPRLADVFGFALFAVGIVGEAVADAQLQRFKADSSNRNKVCANGLWSRSRHPNYFFEWLFWVACAVVAIDPTGGWPYGWVALLAPAAMYWTLRYVSGVPPLEEQMMRTRPEAFRVYQAQTPIFFPSLARRRR